MTSDPLREQQAGASADGQDCLPSQPVDREEQLCRAQAALKRAEREQAALREELEEVAAAEQERLREVILLTNLLKTAEDNREEFAQRLVWSASVHECLVAQPWWWPLLPTRRLRERQLRRLRAAGLFDYQAYLRRYPDVREHGMDPLSHYLLHGLKEGRSRLSDKDQCGRG